MRYCDGINDVHTTKTLFHNSEVEVAYCVKCKLRVYLRKGFDGRDDPRYGTFFKADTLQPSSNLYYKVHPHKLEGGVEVARLSLTQ